MALRIRNGDWVLIGDGKKALLLVNEGDADLLDLRQRSVRVQESSATHEQGADKPGRTFSSVSSGRSAYGQTDWHELDEERFAHEIAEEINRASQADDFKYLTVIAPPKTLADLRHKFSEKTKNKIIAEIDKDLTKHPVGEIEKLLPTYDV